MINEDRELLRRLSRATAAAGRINALAGQVVLQLLDAAEDTGDLEPDSLLRLADALTPVAGELNAVLAALRKRAGDLGVVDAPPGDPAAPALTDSELTAPEHPEGGPRP